MSDKRLTRSKSDCMLFGVAGGLAEYFNLDPVLVRLFFVLLGFATHGQIVIVYVLLAILMPVRKTGGKANAFDEDEIVIKDA